jgi:hypothetical protein
MSGNQMERVLVIANSLGQPLTTHDLNPLAFGGKEDIFDLVCLWDISLANL